jgi:hypothetical protein
LRVRLLWISLCSSLLWGCANDAPYHPKRPPPDLVTLTDIEVPSKFVLEPVNAQNLASVIAPCIPWLASDAGFLNQARLKLPESKKTLLVYVHQRTGNLFVISDNQAYCVQQSASRYPVLAAEALIDTVNAVSSRADIIEGWHKQIAKRLATVGMVKVAYVYTESGSAHVASYWLDSNMPRLGIKYSYVLRKKGEWEKELIDLQFSHPSVTGIMTTKRGADSLKIDPAEHRFKPLPRNRPAL